MVKISVPADLSAFDRTAEFIFTGSTAEADTPIEARLENADNGEVLAARRLRLGHDSTAKFDVAPLLRRAAMLQPSDRPTGLAAAEGAAFRVRMRVGTAVSDIVTLVCTRPQTGATALLCESAAGGSGTATLPVRRRLARGESDVLTFFAAGAFTVTLEAATDSASRSYTYRWEGAGGIVALRLRTSDFGAQTRRIAVRLNGTVVAICDIGEPAAGGVRMAWRTRSGLLEHYTFASVVRRMQVSSAPRVQTADGAIAAAGGSHIETVVKSHCEPAATAELLAGIVASPQVWAVDDATGAYEPLTVVTQQAESHRWGRPTSVELTVRPSKNGVRS